MQCEDGRPEKPARSSPWAFTRTSWLRLFFLALTGSTALAMYAFIAQESSANKIIFRGKGSLPVETRATQTTQTETLTLLFVVCGFYYDLSVTAVKSAVAYSYSKLHLIIVADEASLDTWKKEVDRWPEAIRRRVHADVRDLQYPFNDLNYWRFLNKLCSTQKLFLSSMLPEEDAVMYVDVDVVFVRPVEYVWQTFKAMNANQIAAMALDATKPEHTRFASAGTTLSSNRLGLDTGLVLMNLTRMREFGFERRIEDAWRQHGAHTLLSDNELLETIFTQHLELVYALDSPWNFRRSDCYKSANNIDQHVAAVHGNKDTFREGTEPAFAAVYKSMKRYTLGGSLVETFIPSLEKALNAGTNTLCRREFLRQLPIWRLWATRVDCMATKNASRKSSESAPLGLPPACSAFGLN